MYSDQITVMPVSRNQYAVLANAQYHGAGSLAYLILDTNRAILSNSRSGYPSLSAVLAFCFWYWQSILSYCWPSLSIVAAKPFPLGDLFTQSDSTADTKTFGRRDPL